MSLLVWALSGKSKKLNLLEQVLTSLSLSAVLIWVFPQSVLAQSAQAPTTPKLAFEINENTNYAAELIGDTDIARIDALKNYLVQKNSPLQNHIEVLLAQPNWKLVLSISHAESNMCRRQLGNNCWGIGGAKYHRFYPGFAEGVVDANNLIQKYQDSGLTTPKKMMHRWVGWNNPNWVVANNQVLAELDKLGI